MEKINGISYSSYLIGIMLLTFMNGFIIFFYMNSDNHYKVPDIDLSFLDPAIPSHLPITEIKSPHNICHYILVFSIGATIFFFIKIFLFSLGFIIPLAMFSFLDIILIDSIREINELNERGRYVQQQFRK